MIRRERRIVERLGEMRKGRRDRIEKGSRERMEIEKRERDKRPKRCSSEVLVSGGAAW